MNYPSIHIHFKSQKDIDTAYVAQLDALKDSVRIVEDVKELRKIEIELMDTLAAVKNKMYHLTNKQVANI